MPTFWLIVSPCVNVLKAKYKKKKKKKAINIAWIVSDDNDKFMTSYYYTSHFPLSSMLFPLLFLFPSYLYHLLVILFAIFTPTNQNPKRQD